MPEGIPNEGWFFQLAPTAKGCKIWHNGTVVGGVTNLRIEANANVPFISAHVDTIEISGSCQLPDQAVSVRKVLIEHSSQLSLPISEREPLHHPDADSINLSSVLAWLSMNAKDCPDYDIVRFFAVKADKICESELASPICFEFYMPDKSVVRWSLDEGWDYPVEDVIRALWNAFHCHGSPDCPLDFGNDPRT